LLFTIRESRRKDSIKRLGRENGKGTKDSVPHFAFLKEIDHVSLFWGKLKRAWLLAGGRRQNNLGFVRR
jgi:hypothetical protein